MSQHELVPLGARRALYTVAIILAIASPFIGVIWPEYSQAIIVSLGVIAAVTGTSSLAHPTLPKQTNDGDYNGTN